MSLCFDLKRNSVFSQTMLMMRFFVCLHDPHTCWTIATVHGTHVVVQHIPCTVVSSCVRGVLTTGLSVMVVPSPCLFVACPLAAHHRQNCVPLHMRWIVH